MFIDVTEIRKSPGMTFHFDLQETVGPMVNDGDEVRVLKPVDVSLDIKNTGNVLVFTGKIKGETELVCSRCLESYPVHLEAAFEEGFYHASDVTKVGEDGLDPDELHVFEGSRIKLDDIINEIIVVEVPMKSICSESCKGLCAVCGGNLNKNNCGCIVDDIDPRLADLKKFFKV